MAVDGKCTSNGLDTALRTAPAHRYSSGKLSSTRDKLMTFMPIYSVLFGVSKI